LVEERANFVVGKFLAESYPDLQQEAPLAAMKRITEIAFPLPLPPSLPSSAALDNFLKHYTLLKMAGLSAYREDLDLSLTPPIPPAGTLAMWERTCLQLPSFSLDSEDDFI